MEEFLRWELKKETSKERKQCLAPSPPPPPECLPVKHRSSLDLAAIGLPKDVVRSTSSGKTQGCGAVGYGHQ